MAEYHEIKLVNLDTNEVVDNFLINDDFLDYVGQESQEAFDLFNRIPVLFPTQNDLHNLIIFKNMQPIKKGICIASPNVLNKFSFKDLSCLVEIWRLFALKLEGDFYYMSKYGFNEEEKRGLTTKEIRELTKNYLNKKELIYNINKFIEVLKNLSINSDNYILVWEGI